MSVFKCKMCGGTLEINESQTIATCEYCGTQQTLPRLEDDRRANLYDRANHFRRSNEFDKAMGIYEQILAEDSSDAEAYWSLVLCRYGIEYVEDPVTHKRVPTVNRAQYTSIFDDDNYNSALRCADAAQRGIYEAEAHAINEIQKGILAISQQEEPFDVFICYKETDSSGRRTPDSVLANDLYHQLTQEGFKVFFSRITLEDKLGSAYEPYIFAALNSAKVMVALGTRPEYFKAVWVKNEWSRYLALIRQGQKKMLIPAYKDMDPYDLPEEFSHLQAQDMAKLGFMQDLIRGIRKILQADAPRPVVKETTVVTGGGNAAPLLERAFLFLEDGDWNSANEYCEKALDIDPKNAQAYLGKLMAELHVPTWERLQEYPMEITARDNYNKALRFADDKLRAALTATSEHIVQRRLQATYDGIKQQMECADSESKWKALAEQFEAIRDFEDAAQQSEECLRRAEECRKDAIYQAAKARMDVGQFPKAMEQLGEIPDWKDAAALTAICRQKLEEQRLEGERSRQKAKKVAAIALPIVAAVIVVVVLLTQVILPNVKTNAKYNDALALLEAGQYDEAIAAFEALEGYKDSEEQITECKYLDAVALMEAGQYDEAIAAFKALEGYKDSEEQITERKYLDAVALMEAGQYDKAIAAFEALEGYKDSEAQIETYLGGKYNDAVTLLEKGDSMGALALFWKAGTYKDAKDRCKELLISLTPRETIGVYQGYAAGLKSDGTVVTAGSSLWKQDVSDWRDIVAISVGISHTVGLKSDGTVVATGMTSDGQCNVSDWTDIVAISAGGNHTVGLKSDGTVVATGKTSDGQCFMSGWTHIMAISAGFRHTVGLKADGTVVAVGANDDGRCNVTSWTDIVAISAASYHTVGLKADGTVVAAGNNDDGQCNVSGWTDIVAISAGGSYTVGLKSDGTVVATGDNDNGQCNVSGWRGIVSISAGYSHTVGLKSNGSVVATEATGTMLMSIYKNFQRDLSGWTNIKLPK